MPNYAIFEASGIFDARSLVVTSRNEKTLSATAGKHKVKTQPFPESDKRKINLPTAYQKRNVSVVGVSQRLSHEYPFKYSSKAYQKVRVVLNVNIIGKVSKYRALRVSTNPMPVGS